jgi:predicted nucleic acid-binding protein
MTVYIDTSVILRILFREPNPVELWGKWERAFSSRLWRVEALRNVDRLRLSGDLADEEVADLVREIRVVHETLAIYALTERILQQRKRDIPNRGGKSGRHSFGHCACDTGS